MIFMSDIIGSNLLSGANARPDLTATDPEAYPITLRVQESHENKVAQIVGKTKLLNDTFIVSDTSHRNSIIYNADEAFIIDGMESAASWSDQSGSLTETITNDSTASHYWTGTQGVNISWAESSGTGIIRSIQSYGNFQNAVGVASGTPSRGTFGVWVYTPVASAQSSFKLRIGSDASNYAQYTATFYAQTEWSNTFSNGVRTLLQFDADNPTSVTGTPVWTAIDWIEIEWTANAAGNFTIDYLTISKSNEISLCGVGDRQSDAVTQFTQSSG